MSLTIIEGKFKTITEYRLNYDIDKTGGYSFPCDRDGNIVVTDTNRENVEYCRNHPEMFIRPAYVETREMNYKEPTIGHCNCGKQFEMYNQYNGAVQCPKCGQWYNLWGQELLPPDKWGRLEYDY